MERPSSAFGLQLLLRWIILTISLFVAYLLLPGIRIQGNAIVALAVVALLIGFINALISPLLTQLAFGSMARMATVFMFVVNAVILWLAAAAARVFFGVGLTIDGFVWAFLGAIVVSVLTELLTRFLPSERTAQGLMSADAQAAPLDARTVTKRVFAVVAMLISLVLLVANLAGVVGVWVARGPVTSTVVTWLARVEPVLEAADNAFERVNEELQRARGYVDRVETLVTQLGSNVVNNQLVLTVISNTVGVQLVQTVVRTGEVVTSAGETVRSVNNTLEAINALPFASAPTLPDDVVAVAERMAGLEAEVQALQDRVTSFKADVVGGAVAEVTSRTARIDGLLAEIKSRTIRSGEQIKQARQAVAIAKAEAPGWITLAALVITLLLVWITFSQAVVFVCAWSLAGFKPLFGWSLVRYSPDRH